jgi:plastocyanin
MMLGVGLTALFALVAIVASIVAVSSKTSTTTTIVRQSAPASGQPAKAGGAASMGSHMGGPAGSASMLGSGTAQAAAGAVVPIVLQVDATTGLSGTITGQSGWPRYAPSNITVPAGKKVTLVITNFDDVATPLNPGVPYNHIQGGQETVNGQPVTYVSNKVIAHTFTITGLGLNAAIPMAPHGGSTTVTFTFKAPTKAGTYTWQCYTPCGSGKNGTGGPMMKNGYMQGVLTVA